MGAMGFFVRWCVGLAKPTTQTTDAERDCLAKHAAGKERVVDGGGLAVLAEAGQVHGLVAELGGDVGLGEPGLQLRRPGRKKGTTDEHG